MTAERWWELDACPGCDGTAAERLGRLPGDHYRFGGQHIVHPAGGVFLRRCRGCTLVYKGVVPSPSFFYRVMAEHAARVWAGRYSFRREARLLRDTLGRSDFDLLDVGAGGGGLLRALGGSGRRSVLGPIPADPARTGSITDEFIWGFPDAPTLTWGGRPYDAVTLFDVLEQLYTPLQAVTNVAAFVKPGGLLLIETGDVESAWPRRFGPQVWWYANLFEHHVLWSELALRNLFPADGFEVVGVTRKRHKLKAELGWSKLARDGLKAGLYRASPWVYRRLSGGLGRSHLQPPDPLTHDHLQVLLRRRAEAASPAAADLAAPGDGRTRGPGPWQRGEAERVRVQGAAD